MPQLPKQTKESIRYGLLGLSVIHDGPNRPGRRRGLFDRLKPQWRRLQHRPVEALSALAKIADRFVSP